MTTQDRIHLQGLGAVPAIPMSEIKAGDTLVWNQGCKSRVVAVRYVTPKTIELTTERWTARKRATALVCRLAA